MRPYLALIRNDVRLAFRLKAVMSQPVTGGTRWHVKPVGFELTSIESTLPPEDEGMTTVMGLAGNLSAFCAAA